MSAEGQELENLRFADAFNPAQLRYNCFFVALGRVSHVDSKMLAALASDDESKVDEACGADHNTQQNVLRSLETKYNLRFTQLRLRQKKHRRQRERIHEAGAPRKLRILEAIQAEGLVGRCFAVGLSWKNSAGEYSGHFVNLEYRPQFKLGDTIVDGEMWCVDSDRPTGACCHCHPGLAEHIGALSAQSWAFRNVESWVLRDFQSHNRHLERSFEAAEVDLIFGGTINTSATVYGNTKALGFAENLEAKPITELFPKTSWSEDSREWSFELYQFGHWAKGPCIGENQSKDIIPHWDHTNSWSYTFGNPSDLNAVWHYAEDSCLRKHNWPAYHK